MIEKLRKKKRLLIIALIIIVIGIFVYSKNNSNETNIYTVEKKDLDLVVESRGYVESDENAQLYFKIADKVTGVFIEEGDWVNKGDVLVALSPNSTDLDITYAKDNRDVALLERDLFIEKYQNDVDDVGGKNEYEIQLKTYQEKANKAEAQYQKTLLNMSDTVLRAPFDGTVSKVMVVEGELSSVSRPAVEIQNVNNLSIYARVSEVDIEYVNIDDPVEITFDAFPDKTFMGKVTKINSTAQIVQGIAYYKVTVVTDEVPDTLKAGMNADVNIIAESRKGVVTLPLYLINNVKPGYGSVTVETGDGSNVVEVKLGLKSYTEAEVLEGVGVGDRVVYGE